MLHTCRDLVDVRLQKVLVPDHKVYALDVTENNGTFATIGRERFAQCIKLRMTLHTIVVWVF